MKEEKLNWMNITYGQFLKIKDACEIEDETDKTVALVLAVFGDDVVELPLSEFKQYAQKLDFMKNEVPNDLTVKNCTIKGREYEFQGLLGNISTAQYIDFVNFTKKEDEAKAFSVFFVPKGHKYGDGYDMEQVFKDIMEIPVPVLLSASFFFNRQLNLFIKIFQRSLTKKIMKQKVIPLNLRKKLVKIATSLVNSELYHMS